MRCMLLPRINKAKLLVCYLMLVPTAYRSLMTFATFVSLCAFLILFQFSSNKAPPQREGATMDSRTVTNSSFRGPTRMASIHYFIELLDRFN